MKRSIAAYYIDKHGRTPRWMRWVVLTFFCEADVPAPRWHKALRLALWAVLALGLVMMAERLNAQPFPTYGQPDEWTLDQIDPDRFEVQFHNAHPPRSSHYPETLNVPGMSVGLHIEIGSGPERMTVTPPEGWLALPPVIDVVDGDTGVVQIIRADAWSGM